jgi:alkanesulfonate monooxygenase SsuD/methylene tetrahydromethanopterin reductase-like flavin-dependent oxidoreductase (luciferase family)
VPRPIQRPHPPLWVAASNFATYEHAGSQGFGVIGVTRNTPAETRPWIRAYRERLRASDPATFPGGYANEQVAAFALGCVHDDDRIGRDLGCAAARWYYGDNEAELNRIRFASAAGGVRQIADKIARRSNDELIADAMAIGGNPDTVCRQVEQWAAAGLDQFVFMFQAGHTTHAQVMRAIELVGERVIPRFAD